MDTPLEHLLKKALHSYRVGREKPSFLSAAASGLGFDHHLEASISVRLTLKEQLLMRVSAGARARALSAARSGNLRVARQALDESLDILHSVSLSTEAKYMVRSFHEAVEAYLAYKHGQFDQAHRRILEALETDGILITRYGYKILDLHRIQLGHNLMRIKVRENHLKEAAQLCCNLLHYIEGDKESWPFPEFRDGSYPADLPLDLLAAMFNQITGELAFLLVGRTEDEAATTFAPLIPLTEDTISHDCQHRRAREWLRTKLAFIRGDDGAFLEDVSRLLQEGPGEITLLWRAAATDLYSFCYAFESDSSSALRGEIAADAWTWRPLSIQLRAMFEPASEESQRVVT